MEYNHKDEKTGAEALIKTAVDAGIKVCYANAGTTEIPILLALDRYPEIKTVLCLFEGVCTGAADGYGRMTGSPAMTLLHLGPGFANGIANLHNARRAQTPLLNIIGQHSTWHIPADPPLNMELEALVKTASDWVRTNNNPDIISRDTIDAIHTAYGNKTASLIIPHNHQTALFNHKIEILPEIKKETIDMKNIEYVAYEMGRANKVALLLGGGALRKKGLEIVKRIQSKTGCYILTETFPGYIDRGGGLPYVEKIPYFPEGAKDLLSPFELVVLVGAKEPVTFFGYEGIDSYLITKDQKKVYLCNEKHDIYTAMEYLAEALETGNKYYARKTVAPDKLRSNMPTGKLTPDKLSHIVAALQPEDAIIVDEGLTSFFAYYSLSAGQSPHTVLTITGGAIGYGMPCAIGAAMACPERPVINVQADGSALYTVQALWTQAHESMNIKTLICSNRSYNILKIELGRAGITHPGKSSLSLMDIDKPYVDWVKIARGFGIKAVSVETAEDLTKEFKNALIEKGPHLIEMIL
ncbi:MAG TPA: acetolactate synthase large subunit [Syntrophorhabdaceae bacterium]|nr:acetolactate synthase large subunit [Syntrophorhabdaceae bacterium]